MQKFLIKLVLELRPLQLLPSGLQRRGNISLFENVTILQFLSVRTNCKTLLQGLERFRAQRILAGWASDGDGSLSSSGGGGVGGSYEGIHGGLC